MDPRKKLIGLFIVLAIAVASLIGVVGLNKDLFLGSMLITRRITPPIKPTTACKALGDAWLAGTLDLNKLDAAIDCTKKSAFNPDQVVANAKVCKTVADLNKLGKLTPTLNALGIRMRLLGECNRLFPNPPNLNTVNRQNCQVIADWMRQGTLTANSTAQGVTYATQLQCEQTYPDIWYGGLSQGLCYALGYWFAQGKLTSNIQTGSIDPTLPQQCEKQYPIPFYGFSSQGCQTLKNWLTTGLLTQNMSKNLTNSSEIDHCVNVYPDVWYGLDKCGTLQYYKDHQWTSYPHDLQIKMAEHKPPFTDQDLLSCNLSLNIFNRANCQILAIWAKQGTLTANMNSQGVTLNAGLCEQTYPDIWYGGVSAGACNILGVWAAQGKLTPTMQANGIDPVLFNQCATMYPTFLFYNAPPQYCGILKSWLDQGVLTANMAKGQAFQHNVDLCSTTYPEIWYGLDQCGMINWWRQHYDANGLSQKMREHVPPVTAQDLQNCPVR